MTYNDDCEFCLRRQHRQRLRQRRVFRDAVRTKIMKTFIRLVVGSVELFGYVFGASGSILVGLLFITIMTGVFGIGGFFFTLGLFGVMVWAFAK